MTTSSPPRTALVTGANRGLGLHFVDQLQRRGWQVIAACRRPDGADELRSLHPLAIVSCDTGDPVSIAALADSVAPITERLGLLVNNAGIMSPSAAPVDELPTDDAAANGPLTALEPEALATMFRINSIGPVLVVQALRPLLGDGAAIVNLSSRLGSIGHGSNTDYGYGMSKAALNMATAVLGRELGPAGIITVAVSPGWVRTDMGGAAASLTPEQSTGSIAALVDRLGAEHNGCFLDIDGAPIPW
jgi:NAD(P)-dependent dehydrogenase (short-subunit alcohol dehydrogenase family)